MQALPEGVTTAAELRAHYRRAAKNIVRPKPVLIVDNTPEAVPVPILYHSPKVFYLPQRQTVYLLADEAPRVVSIRLGTIKEAASSLYGVTVQEIDSDGRIAKVVRARQVVMYLAKKLSRLSLTEIGRRIGGRDHSTVIHGASKIERLLETDAKLRREVESLQARIGGAA
jgi:hypothetical protein